jgi:hypothetical protein
MEAIDNIRARELVKAHTTLAYGATVSPRITTIDIQQGTVACGSWASTLHLIRPRLINRQVFNDG